MNSLRPKIVLTGASGLIGNAILHALQDHHFSTLALTRRPLEDHPNTQQIHFDLQQTDDSLIAPFTRFKAELLIHAGWIGCNNQQRDDQDMLRANHHASMQLLDIAQKAGCKRIIGFGSQAEYSPNLQQAIDETAPTQADTAYGVAKRELYLQQQAFCEKHDMHLLWLRLFTCYGKRMHSNYLIPYLIDCFKRGIPPHIKSPHAVGDYLDIRDTAAAIIKTIEKPTMSGLYNLASGKGVSVGDVAIQLAEFFPNVDLAALRNSIKNNQQPTSHRVADARAFMRDFGWKPSISLSEGLRQCL